MSETLHAASADDPDLLLAAVIEPVSENLPGDDAT